MGEELFFEEGDEFVTVGYCLVDYEYAPSDVLVLPEGDYGLEGYTCVYYASD